MESYFQQEHQQGTKPVASVTTPLHSITPTTPRCTSPMMHCNSAGASATSVAGAGLSDDIGHHNYNNSWRFGSSGTASVDGSQQATTGLATTTMMTSGGGRGNSVSTTTTTTTTTTGRQQQQRYSDPAVHVGNPAAAAAAVSGGGGQQLSSGGVHRPLVVVASPTHQQQWFPIQQQHHGNSNHASVNGGQISGGGRGASTPSSLSASPHGFGSSSSPHGGVGGLHAYQRSGMHAGGAMAAGHGSGGSAPPQLPNAQQQLALQQQQTAAAAQGLLIVVDPLSRKLRVPLSAVTPTRAMSRAGIPSLCLLHLSNRCRQDGNCHQVHANPAVVQQLRDLAANQPTCCAHHGDVNDGSRKQSWSRVEIQIQHVAVPVDRIAFTAGLKRVMDDNAAMLSQCTSALGTQQSPHTMLLQQSTATTTTLHGQPSHPPSLITVGGRPLPYSASMSDTTTVTSCGLTGNASGSKRESLEIIKGGCVTTSSSTTSVASPAGSAPPSAKDIDDKMLEQLVAEGEEEQQRQQQDTSHFQQQQQQQQQHHACVAQPIVVPPANVCRLHGEKGGCRYAEDCKFLHVCREIIRHDLAGLLPQAPPAAASSESSPHHRPSSSASPIPRPQSSNSVFSSQTSSPIHFPHQTTSIFVQGNSVQSNASSYGSHAMGHNSMQQQQQQLTNSSPQQQHLMLQHLHAQQQQQQQQQQQVAGQQPQHHSAQQQSQHHHHHPSQQQQQQYILQQDANGNYVFVPVLVVQQQQQQHHASASTTPQSHHLMPPSGPPTVAASPQFGPSANTTQPHSHHTSVAFATPHGSPHQRMAPMNGGQYGVGSPQFTSSLNSERTLSGCSPALSSCGGGALSPFTMVPVVPNPTSHVGGNGSAASSAAPHAHQQYNSYTAAPASSATNRPPPHPSAMPSSSFQNQQQNQQQQQQQQQSQTSAAPTSNEKAMTMQQQQQLTASFAGNGSLAFPSSSFAAANNQSFPNFSIFSNAMGIGGANAGGGNTVRPSSHTSSCCASPPMAGSPRDRTHSIALGIAPHRGGGGMQPHMPTTSSGCVNADGTIANEVDLVRGIEELLRGE